MRCEAHEAQFCIFITPSLQWSGCKLKAPVALPDGISPGTRCRKGWMGLRDDLDGYGEQRVPWPHRISNSRLFNSWRIAIPTMQSAKKKTRSTYYFFAPIKNPHFKYTTNGPKN
jgi:hypothetical protein